MRFATHALHASAVISVSISLLGATSASSEFAVLLLLVWSLFIVAILSKSRRVMLTNCTLVLAWCGVSAWFLFPLAGTNALLLTIGFFGVHQFSQSS